MVILGKTSKNNKVAFVVGDANGVSVYTSEEVAKLIKKKEIENATATKCKNGSYRIKVLG